MDRADGILLIACVIFFLAFQWMYMQYLDKKEQAEQLQKEVIELTQQNEKLILKLENYENDERTN